MIEVILGEVIAVIVQPALFPNLDSLRSTLGNTRRWIGYEPIGVCHLANRLDGVAYLAVRHRRLTLARVRLVEVKRLAYSGLSVVGTFENQLRDLVG